jgi:hypothetical protein
MRFILSLASGVSGFIASAAVLLWVPHVIRALPLRGSSWAESPIKNLIYGEFGVWLVLVLTLAFALGFTLARLFGDATRDDHGCRACPRTWDMVDVYCG